MDQRTPRQPSCVLSEPDQQSRWREPVVPDHFGTGTGFMEEKFFHHLAVFQLKPHRNITRRKFAIKKAQPHHLYDIRKEMRCR